MKDWEKRNAEEMVEGLVGMDLDGIEVTVGELSDKILDRLGKYLTERYKSPAPRTFAGILRGICIIEAANRYEKGGAGE